MRIVVLNGVNLDEVGRRDPAVYGGLTGNELETRIYRWCHEALDWADGVIVNPGAWSHYSWAIHDALEMFKVPIVEVHLSNVDEREEWRRFSVVAELAATRIIGKGPDGYREALEYLKEAQ